jgi:hypothetical protein
MFDNYCDKCLCDNVNVFMKRTLAQNDALGKSEKHISFHITHWFMFILILVYFCRLYDSSILLQNNMFYGSINGLF